MANTKKETRGNEDLSHGDNIPANAEESIFPTMKLEIEIRKDWFPILEKLRDNEAFEDISDMFRFALRNQFRDQLLSQDSESVIRIPHIDELLKQNPIPDNLKPIIKRLNHPEFAQFFIEFWIHRETHALIVKALKSIIVLD
jgi:hypothetical protein